MDQANNKVYATGGRWAGGVLLVDIRLLLVGAGGKKDGNGLGSSISPV